MLVRGENRTDRGLPRVRGDPVVVLAAVPTETAGCCGGGGGGGGGAAVVMDAKERCTSNGGDKRGPEDLVEESKLW